MDHLDQLPHTFWDFTFRGHALNGSTTLHLLNPRHPVFQSQISNLSKSVHLLYGAVMRWQWIDDDEKTYLRISLDDGCVVELVNGGWIEFINADNADSRDSLFTYDETWLHARTHPGDRIVIDGLLTRGVRVTSADLDEIQLGRIEKLLNSPGVKETFQALEATNRILAIGTTPDSMMSQIRDNFGLTRYASLTEVVEEVGSLTLEPPPQGGRFPDSFYLSLAAAYSHAGANSNSPAKAIAEANDIAVTTVHGWVKEARARGLLAPSSRSVHPMEDRDQAPTSQPAEQR